MNYFLCCVFLFLSCQDRELLHSHFQESEKEWDSEVMVEYVDVKIDISDQGRLFAKLQAPQLLIIKGGIEKYPKGIHIVFFDSLGNKKNSLKADKAVKDTGKNLYEAEGRVVLKNFPLQQTLMTEKIYWDRIKREIYSDTIVKIFTPQEQIEGRGLRATEDMSEYEIIEPIGILRIQTVEKEK